MKLPWKLSNPEAWIAGRRLVTDQARLIHGPLGVLVTTTHAATRWNVSIEGKPFACNPEAISGEMAMALPVVEAQIRRLVGALTCVGFGVPSEATLVNNALDRVLIQAGVPEGLGLAGGVQWLATELASVRGASQDGCWLHGSHPDVEALQTEIANLQELARVDAATIARLEEEAATARSLRAAEVERLRPEEGWLLAPYLRAAQYKACAAPGCVDQSTGLRRGCAREQNAGEEGGQ